MNEKIKELAEQAGYSKDFLAIGLPSNMEKFAELIVRECAKLSKDRANHIVAQAEKVADDEDEITSAQATAWQFLVLEAEIKQHFGVDK